MQASDLVCKFCTALDISFLPCLDPSEQLLTDPRKPVTGTDSQDPGLQIRLSSQTIRHMLTSL